MGRRTLARFDELWMRHESLYTDVFSLALAVLTGRPFVVGNEDAISESLCPILRQVCFKMDRDGRGEVREPTWERPLQPVSDEELTGGKKRKRPDFTCSCYNRVASGPDEHEVPFHVECKRLGSPTSRSWNLNKNYVVKGMKRFDCGEHEYGKRAPSGMMIGYIISLTPHDIVTEVNGYKNRHFKNCPDITFAWNSGYVHRTKQSITRQEVAPANFRLTHIWADLRHNYRWIREGTLTVLGMDLFASLILHHGVSRRPPDRRALRKSPRGRAPATDCLTTPGRLDTVPTMRGYDREQNGRPVKRSSLPRFRRLILVSRGPPLEG